MSSNLSEAKQRQVRAAPFVLTLLCCLLPFVILLHDGEPVANLTGIQLLTGTEVAQSTPHAGQALHLRIPHNVGLALALLCAAAAAGACFLAGQAGKLLPAIVGGVGLTCLLFAKVHLDHEAANHAQGGVVNLNYQIGFVLACLLLIIGICSSGLQYRQSEPSDGDSGSLTEPALHAALNRTEAGESPAQPEDASTPAEGPTPPAPSSATDPAD